jgi:hypothetical protein
MIPAEFSIEDCSLAGLKFIRVFEMSLHGDDEIFDLDAQESVEMKNGWRREVL